MDILTRMQRALRIYAAQSVWEAGMPADEVIRQADIWICGFYAAMDQGIALVEDKTTDEEKVAIVPQLIALIKPESDNANKGWNVALHHMIDDLVTLRREGPDGVTKKLLEGLL